MKKFVLMALTGLAVAAPAFVSAAQAEDVAATTEVTTETTETVAVETVEKKLQDGTVIHVKGEEVFVVAADGTETAAPDGVHTLDDATTVETKDGKVVVAPVAEEAAH